jgi:opacity protein-like surface antigen
MTFKRLALVLVLLLASTSLQAQRFNKKPDYAGLRDGTWEAAALIGNQSSVSAAGENGSSIDIKSEFGWGFSLGWNMTPKWNFSWTFMLAEPGYSATVVPEDPEEPAQTLNYTASRYSNQLKATYHFFSGPLTPYLQAGIGYAKLDSNIPSTPPVTGCWWDPWWGYICATDWRTFSTSEFTYNVGLGFRWDINGALWMRGTWNREFFSTDRADLDFDTLTLEAGLMW